MLYKGKKPKQNKTNNDDISYFLILDRTSLLTQKQLEQDYDAPRLKSSPQNFHSCHHELVERYKLYISQMAIDLFRVVYHSALCDFYWEYRKKCMQRTYMSSMGLGQ